MSLNTHNRRTWRQGPKRLALSILLALAAIALGGCVAAAGGALLATSGTVAYEKNKDGVENGGPIPDGPAGDAASPRPSLRWPEEPAASTSAAPRGGFVSAGHLEEAPPIHVITSAEIRPARVEPNLVRPNVIKPKPPRSAAPPPSPAPRPKPWTRPTPSPIQPAPKTAAAAKPEKPTAEKPAPEKPTPKKAAPEKPAPAKEEPPKPPSRSGEVALKWQTAEEVEVRGFNVWRAESPDGPWKMANPTVVPAAGNSTETRSYEFTDSDLAAGTVYYYYLQEVLSSGERQKISGVMPYAAREAE
jgi:hypothetical protein